MASNPLDKAILDAVVGVNVDVMFPEDVSLHGTPFDRKERVAHMQRLGHACAPAT